MTSFLRPPYHHDVAALFRRLAATVLSGIVAAAFSAAALAGSAVLDPGRALELQQQQALTIVDIRRPEEWRATGIPAGAERATIRSPWGNKGFLERIAVITKGDKEMPIGLICAAGNRSRRAAELLQQQGYRNIIDISEGMFGNAQGAGWLARELPVTPCTDCQ